jgi:hypothetical protein
MRDVTSGSDPYKGDLEAAHARLQALERENEELRTRLDGRAGASAKPKRARPVLRVLVICAGLLLCLAFLGFAGTMVRIGGGRGAVVVVGGRVLLTAVVLAFVLSRLACVCGPNEALIISGRNRVGPDGKVRGYRVVRGGRCVRMPLIERVDRVDLTPVPVSTDLARVLAKDGTSLDLHVTATVRIGADPLLLDRAVERFLGSSVDEVPRVGGEIIEGCVRVLVATLDAEAVERDRQRITDQITRDAAEPLAAIGISLEQLSIGPALDEFGAPA